MAVRQVWIYCAKEAGVQDHVGQRVGLSDQVTVGKLDDGIRNDLDGFVIIAGGGNIIQRRIIGAGVI